MNKLKPLHNSSIRHSVLNTESNKHLIILDSRFRGNDAIADFTKLCKGFNFKPILAVILCFFFFSPAFAKPPDEALNAVLTSAEATFKAMKEKNYPAIWKTLTAKTKNSAVDAVYKASRKEKVEYQKEIIIADFEKGGELAKAYWDGYLGAFDPDMVLEQSRWDIGAIGKETAEVNIQYRKSTKPAVLKLYREDNAWKVGLEETFGARNLLPY